MKNKTVTSFVRSLPTEKLLRAFAAIKEPAITEISVPLKRPTGDSLVGAGVEFHEAFEACNQGEWVDSALYPFVRAERKFLSELGVSGVYTEWSHVRSDTGLVGVVDASITGGPKAFGVLENKITDGDPEDGFVEDIAQVACYCLLAAGNGRPLVKQWAALCYVMPVQQKLRILVWGDVRTLVEPLSDLLDA